MKKTKKEVVKPLSKKVFEKELTELLSVHISEIMRLTNEYIKGQKSK